MSFILDDIHQYEVFKDGQKIRELRLTVKMAPDSTFYFDSGQGKLYFGKREGVFYFYNLEGTDPALQTMLLALPRLPLACREGLQWSDDLPLGFAAQGLTRAAGQLLSSFCHDMVKTQVTSTCIQKNKIQGSVQASLLNWHAETFVEWDNQFGFKTFRVGNIELQRVINSQS